MPAGANAPAGNSGCVASSGYLARALIARLDLLLLLRAELLVLAASDLDLPSARLGRLRQFERQHPVLVMRRDLLGIDVLREHDGPLEPAVPPLDRPRAFLVAGLA